VTPLIQFGVLSLAVAFSSPGQSAARAGGEWTVRMEGSRIVFPALEKTIA
jgi:hypothetical protein